MIKEKIKTLESQLENEKKLITEYIKEIESFIVKECNEKIFPDFLDSLKITKVKYIYGKTRKVIFSYCSSKLFEIFWSNRDNLLISFSNIEFDSNDYNYNFKLEELQFIGKFAEQLINNHNVKVILGGLLTCKNINNLESKILKSNYKINKTKTKINEIEKGNTFEFIFQPGNKVKCNHWLNSTTFVVKNVSDNFVLTRCGKTILKDYLVRNIGEYKKL